MKCALQPLQPHSNTELTLAFFSLSCAAFMREPRSLEKFAISYSKACSEYRRSDMPHGVCRDYKPGSVRRSGHAHASQKA